MESPRTLTVLRMIMVVVVIGLAIGVVWQYSSIIRTNEQLEKDGILVHGQITRITDAGKTSDIYYTYSFNGVNFTGDYNHSLSPELYVRLPERHVPIMISKSDPTVSLLMIYRGQFEKFNLEYPDSLHWIDSLR